MSATVGILLGSAAMKMAGGIMSQRKRNKGQKEIEKKAKEKKEIKAQKKAEKVRSGKADKDSMRANLKKRQKDATNSPEFQAKLKRIRKELAEDKKKKSKTK